MASVFGITYIDLQNFTSPETVKAIFDDANTGTLNQVAIAAIIDRGEQEVLSWIVGEYGPPPFTTQVLADLGADPFLKYCALEYIVAHMFDRHPEYVRSGGKERGDRFMRADERMKRVLDARQRPPTVPDKPANVGGVLVDNGPRMYIDSPGSPPSNSNSGDY